MARVTRSRGRGGADGARESRLQAGHTETELVLETQNDMIYIDDGDYGSV